MMSMTPKIRVSPVAMRAYTDPVSIPSLAALSSAVEFKVYLPHAGFGYSILTELGSFVGLTCTNLLPLVPCHWKV